MARNKGKFGQRRLGAHGASKLWKDMWLSVINKGRGTQSLAEETT